jgi:hypothetical protein
LEWKIKEPAGGNPRSYTYTVFCTCSFFYKLFFIGLVNKYRHGSKTRYKGDILTFDFRERNRKKKLNKANKKKKKKKKKKKTRQEK